MKIKKLYNNNILLVEDENLFECILLGKGIGFQKKVGQEVDQSKIDKKFVLESKELTNKFIELLREIPVNHLELTNKIVETAQKRLGIVFNDSIYIGLTDHINYAIHRYKQGENLSNALLWEVKKFYHKEFEAALESIKMIEYYEGIKLTEDEASFIALHFVNGQQGGDEMKLTATATAIIQDILNIVKFHFNIKIDEQSLNYTRFITHIRFFIRRLANREQSSSEDDFLFLQIKEKYPDVYACTLKVKKYLEHKFEIVLTSEEMLYFMLHINRVTEREKTS
jgi:beta-glucoside operon transcriptional antiterminator